MLSLFYLMEGVVRAMSDPAPLSAGLGALEAVLAAIFFLAAIFLCPAGQACRPAGARLMLRKLDSLILDNSFAVLPEAFYTRLQPQVPDNPCLRMPTPRRLS